MDSGDQPTEGRPRRTTTFRSEFAAVLAICVLSGIAVVGLYLIARDEPSAGSNSPDRLLTPVVTTDEACENFADYWMDTSGVGVDAGVIQALTNCRQAGDGTWFVPTGPADPRLPAEFALTDTEREATSATRSALLDEIEALESSITNSVQRDLDAIYDPRVRPIVGQIKDGTGISRPRSRYTRIAQAFLIAPEHELLAGYVGWLMDAKISAYDTLRSACEADSDVHYLLTACGGLEDSLSVRYPPWTWDLRSSVNLEAYLAHLVRSEDLTDSNASATYARNALADTSLVLGSGDAAAWKD